jgi:hypothetical protein
MKGLRDTDRRSCSISDEETESPISGMEAWLKVLDSCCREPDEQAKDEEQFVRWPSARNFEELMMNVELCCGTQRARWTTLKRLDKRMPSLRLVLRVNNLVKRAKDRLADAGEPCVGILSRQALKG